MLTIERGLVVIGGPTAEEAEDSTLMMYSQAATKACLTVQFTVQQLSFVRGEKS